MDNLANHGYSGINDGTKVYHFLQGIKCTELEGAVNVVQAQPEKYGKNFGTTVSYLGWMIMKKGYNM